MSAGQQPDVLVIGGGAAAVRAAIEAAAQDVFVTVVDKGVPGSSGTSPLGLHGMASTINPTTTVEGLIGDVVREGQLVNDIDLVRTAAESSRDEVQGLLRLGVDFARKEDGSYHFYRGTGHSEDYGLTFSERLNGDNFVAILVKEAHRRGVNLVTDTMITDLVVGEGRVLGAIAMDNRGRLRLLKAGAVVLAAGGANRLYPNPVPRISHPMYRTTGDSYAMALRAGLPLVDMEFANFRETPPAARIGKYVNAEGEAFMTRYDARGERASRGTIVEALYRELQRGAGPISIALDPDAERSAHMLTDEYRDYVRESLEGRVPEVTITFQRLLGGARVGADASTCIEGLYAAGEAMGGVHGADRLQGMAFLETQIFGARAGAAAARYAATNRALAGAAGAGEAALQAAASRLLTPPGPATDLMLRELQHVVWECAGVVRSSLGLRAGLSRVRQIRKESEKHSGTRAFDAPELQNLALTAEAVIVSCLAREESRGTHRRSDFPGQRPECSRRHVVVRLTKDGTLETLWTPSRE